MRIDDSTKGLKVLVVGGVGGGTVNTVTDGVTTVSNPTEIDFTSGATVTNLGGGIAGVAVTSGALVVGTTQITSGTNTYIEYNNNGVLGEYAISGTTAVAMTHSPTFVTPALGAATATSINKVSITAPATSATLTIVDGKTLTVSNIITLAGTDGTTMTFPGTSDTVAGLATAQTFTATQTEKLILYSNNAVTASSNTATVPVTYRMTTVTNNAAGSLTITITTTSATDGQLLLVRYIDYSAVAQTLAWTNTTNTLNASVPTTSKGSTTAYSYVGFIFNSAETSWDCIAST